MEANQLKKLAEKFACFVIFAGQINKVRTSLNKPVFKAVSIFKLTN